MTVSRYKQVKRYLREDQVEAIAALAELLHDLNATGGLPNIGLELDRDFAYLQSSLMRAMVDYWFAYSGVPLMIRTAHKLREEDR